jgi:LmbE family N-acetylglucosaminyl deacetylase
VAVWTTAGKDVAYVLATRGEAGIDGIEPERCGPLREAEQRAAAAIVGVDVVEFLDHRDGTLEHGLPLRRDIAAAIRRHRPELVVTINHHDGWGPGSWNSPDHRNLGRALLDGVGDAGNRWIHTDLLDDGLEPWAGVRWVAVSGSPHATHLVALTRDALDRAVASLEAHAEYLRGLGDGPMTDARAFLEGQARAEDGSLRTTFELIGF